MIWSEEEAELVIFKTGIRDYAFQFDTQNFGAVSEHNWTFTLVYNNQ